MTSPPPPGLDLTKVPMVTLYEKYKLDTNVRDFVGHAIALYRDDRYVTFH